MGNIIVGAILTFLFGGIIYYLVHSLRTRGTICTSCKSCTLIDTCDKDVIKNDMLKFYNEQA